MIVKYFIGPLETNGLIGIKIHFDKFLCEIEREKFTQYLQ